MRKSNENQTTYCSFDYKQEKEGSWQKLETLVVEVS